MFTEYRHYEKPEYEKIIRNAIRCNICGEDIESKHVHGYGTCNCGACSADSDHEYLRRTFHEKGCFTELSVAETAKH